MGEQGFGAAAQHGPPLLGPLTSSVHAPSHWLYSRSHTRCRHSASGGRAPSYIGKHTQVPQEADTALGTGMRRTSRPALFSVRFAKIASKWEENVIRYSIIKYVLLPLRGRCVKRWSSVSSGGRTRRLRLGFAAASLSKVQFFFL